MSVSAATRPRQIEKLLTAPSAVAKVLNWQMNAAKSVLTIRLGASGIDMALMSHPGCSSEQAQYYPIHSLPSIPIEKKQSATRRRSSKRELPQQTTTAQPLQGNSNNTNVNKKLLGPEVLKELSDIVRQHNVCGLVVSWPVQSDGWLGASCGRVLHILDEIVQETNIVTPARPVCLWDGHRYHTRRVHDEFDRLPQYCAGYSAATMSSPGTTTPPQEYKFKSRGGGGEEGMSAAAIAANYLQSHWPEMMPLENPATEEKERRPSQQRMAPLPKPLGGEESARATHHYSITKKDQEPDILARLMEELEDSKHLVATTREHANASC